MSKLTRRVLSMVLSVLMVVSMVSVFTLPALAEEVVTDVIDYDAKFETAFIINKSWTDEQLAGTDNLTVTFRGVEKTVNPETHKLFNNFKAAHDAAAAELSVENYFANIPTFVFAAGDYSADGKMHIKFPANIWGPNAGISPNADVTAEDRDIAWIEANGGWPANEAWTSEAVLPDVYFATRMINAEGKIVEVAGDPATVGYTDAEAKFQYLLDQALKADADAEYNLYFDGVTLKGRFDLSTTDYGKKYFYEGAEYTANQTKDRKSDINYKNVKITKAGDFLGFWNTTWFWQTATFDNVRIAQDGFWMGSRFVDEITFTNTYFAKSTKAGFLFNSWVNMTDSIRRNAGVLNVDKCVFYDCTSTTFLYNADNPHKDFKNFTFNLTNSLLYNAGSANWGHFQIYNGQLKANYTGTDADVFAHARGTNDRTVTFNIQDNIMFHNRPTYDSKAGAWTTSPQNTIFNGNAKYIGGGKTIIKFNGNRVIGTVLAVPPNTTYSVAQTNALMDYDFRGNFFSTSVDGVGKEVTFGAGGAPSGDANTSNWSWNWTKGNSFYDYDMQWPTGGTEVTALDAGEENTVGIAGAVIQIEAPSNEGIITPDSFTVNDERAVIELSATADFAETIESIDISDVDGEATYFVRTKYVSDNEAINTASTKTYTMNIICKDAPSFNKALQNGEIEMGGVTFSADDTVVIPNKDTVVTNNKFYAEFNGTLYKFTVDNINVFPYVTGTGFTLGDTGMDLRPARAKAENGNIILLDGFYDNIIVAYPTTIYGSNAGVDPVDKSNATAANGYEAVLNADWDMNGTTFDKIMVREEIDGTVKFDGIVIQESIYDNARKAKDYATFDLVFENIVANEANTGFDNGWIYTGTNGRTGNQSDAEFGKILNDSVTFRNFYIKLATTNQILNENSANTVVFDNVYCDQVAAQRNRETIAFFKGNTHNYNLDVTIMNSIFRNRGTKEVSLCVTYDGDRSKTMFTEDDGHNYHFTVTNNVFYKVGSSATTAVATGALNSFTMTDNIFYAAASGQTLVAYNTHVPSNADCALAGNMIVSGNKLYGYVDIFADLKMGENNPVFADGFYTPAVDGTLGQWHTDMGEEEWYMDENLEVPGSDYYIDDISGGSVDKLIINNGAATISFDMREGTTEDVEIYASNGDATFTWKDAQGNVLDVIDSANFKQALETYYLTVEANGYSRTYTVNITAFDAKVFADDYDFEEGYFGPDAVIVTDAATEDATGNEIYVLWQGTPYGFVVGENAVASIDEALALGATDVLVKSWTANTDFAPKGTINLYSENYNVNPNVTDGLGVNSPSHGRDWGYNTEYDKYKVSIKNLSIAAGVTGKVGLYGFNITGCVADWSRQAGQDLDLHLENVLFTGESIYHGTANGSTTYLFSTNNQNLTNNAEQTDVFTVKNMHVSITSANACARLIGEGAPATFEVDGLYVDASKSAFDEWNSFYKNVAKDSSFILKNSCLLNIQNDKYFMFEGFRFPGGSTGTDLPADYSNTVTFENNIIVGSFGRTTNYTDVLFDSNVNSFSGITVVDNYLEAGYTTLEDGTIKRHAGNLFWAVGLKNKDTSVLKMDVNVSGNVMNGYSRDIVLQHSDMNNVFTNATWVVDNNVIFPTYVEDVTTAVGERPTFFYDEFATFTEENLNTGHGILTSVPVLKLDVNGEIATNVIHEMTAPEGVVIDEEAKTITTTPETVKWEDKSTEKDGVTTYKYKFSLPALLNNPNKNLIKYTIGDKVYTDYNWPTVTTEAAAEGIEFTATVYSPDGTVVGDTYTVIIAEVEVHEHTLTEVPAVDATCTENGHKAYYVCAAEDCGLYFADAEATVAIEDLEAWLAGDGFVAAAHTLTDVDGKDATCEEDGYTAHKACTKCDYKEGYEVIPAAHKWEDAEGKDATCEFPGYTDHKVCTVCGVVKDYNVIPELGHKLVDIEGEDATCTEDGYTSYKVCMNGCGYQTEPDVIPAGHKWGDWTYDNNATNLKDGTESMTCSGCDEKQVRPAPGTKLPTENTTGDPTFRRDEHMPFLTLNESGNGVVLNQNKSWATRVYWGNIGDEYFEYKWFDDDLRLPSGTDYVADYTPQDGEDYNFTKPGWYRFIVKGIRTGTTAEDYTYSELLFDFYYDGTVAPTVPTITELGNNQIKINANGTSIKKFYYGNIGQKNTPYSWFNSFWTVALQTKTYTPVFDTRDGRIITLQTAGYYNIVIVDTANKEYVYTAYAADNAPVITKVDGESKAIVDVDCLKGNVGAKATITKLYYGNAGTTDVDISTWDEFVANVPNRVVNANVAQGTTYNLGNKGYYKFYVVMTLSNGRTVEVVYTVDNN